MKKQSPPLKNTLWKNLLRLLRNAYLILFYNTDFALNVSAGMSWFIPFFLWLIYTEQLSPEFLFPSITFVFVSSFLYVTVYVINDVIDYRKDIGNQVYKASALSMLSLRKYYLLYISYLVIFFGVMAVSFPKWIAPVSVVIVALAPLSLIHSTIAKVKPVTIFLERAVRHIGPVWALAFASNFSVPSINQFLLAVCLFYPILTSPSFSFYLIEKQKMTKLEMINTQIVVYCAYYGTLVFGIAFFGIQPNIFGFLVPYLAIYFVIRLLPKGLRPLLDTLFNIPTLKHAYSEKFDESRRQALMEVIVNGFIIGGIILYSIFS